MSKRLTWALIEGEERRAYAHTGPNRLECLSGASSVRRYVEALEKDAAIWRAAREEDDLVSRLESVAMSWCLAGLHDALNRVKRESTKVVCRPRRRNEVRDGCVSAQPGQRQRRG